MKPRHILIRKYSTELLWLVITTVVFLIWFGYGSIESRVTSCSAHVARYVEAQFSSVRPQVMVNANGGTTTTMVTDYSYEVVSPVYRAVTTNGGRPYKSSNFDTSVVGGIHYPPMPAHDTTVKFESDFDHFQFKSDTKLVTIAVLPSGEDTSFSEPISKYQRCMSKLGGTILTKTWYGITYGSEY